MVAQDSSTIDTNILEVSNVKSIKDPLDPNTGMNTLFTWLMFESTENLRLQKLNELQELASSQAEIAFLSNLRSIFMISAKDDGSFEITDELRKLLSKVSNPGSESLMKLLEEIGLKFTATYTADSFKKMFDEIDALPEDQLTIMKDKLTAIGIDRNSVPTQQQLDELVKLVTNPENLAIRKLLTDNNILSVKQKFTKAERENFIESIRLTVKQMEAMYETKSQSVLHLQSLINQMQEHVLQLVKDYKRIFDKILHNLK